MVARFEAERQSLAMMDHPNIAKVLDAGETEQGEPYFVMELVKGVPITEYCDENRLGTQRTCGIDGRRLQRGPARPSERESSTATSSHPTSWSPSMTIVPCRR